ncbi:MAG: hypothetical protein JW822_03660 [Spirochaetales bacterium]|nr:hypothetical protein [Spirochaetales bacterium]
MDSKKIKTKLFIIIAAVLVLLLVLLLIRLCSSQEGTHAGESESDMHEEMVPEKEPEQEEITEKIEEKESVVDKHEEPLAEQKQKAPEEKIVMFKIVARKKWQYAGIEVTPETTIIISYEEGEWTLGQGWPYTDAEGSPHLDVNRMFRTIAPGALVGKVGNNKEFKIGNYCEISGSHMIGKLNLIMNDEAGYYGDNLGSITVKIIIR